MESTLLETVSLGHSPSLEVEAALADGDARKIWALSQSGIPQRAFLDTVKSHVFHASTLSRKGQTIVAHQNTTMFMWPVVFCNGDVEARTKALQEDSGTSFMDTVNSLSKWMAFNVEVGMLKSPLSYEFLSGQDPVAMRQILNAVTWRKPTEIFSDGTEMINLPHDAPQLVFYVGTMTKRNTWPVMPGEADGSTLDIRTRLRSTLKFVTQDADKDEGDLMIGTPDDADSAIAAGLKMWLFALHKKYTFGQWDVVPCGGDRFGLHVQLINCEETDLYLPLRAYQIGLDAVDMLVAELAKLGLSTEHLSMNIH